MKKLFSLFIILFTAMLIAGCSEGSKTVEIKTMSMFGGTDPHAETYEALLTEFEEEHDVVISDNSATSDEIWKTSVLTAFYSGVEPDVLFYFTGEIAKPLVSNDYVVSIEEIREEYPDFASNISESVMDPYAVPLKGFVEGVFVNTTLFTGDLAPYLEKDVWTWEDYHDIAEKLISNGKIPFAFGATDVPHYWIEHTVLGMLGPDAFADIKGSLEANEDEWVDALTLINDFAELGWFGPTNGNQEHTLAEASFKDGSAAMILDGSWFAGGFDETTDVKASDLIMMPFPAIPTSEGGKNEVYMQSGFTSGFYISRKAWDNPDKRDLVVELVESMINTDAVKEYCKTGGIPADPEVQLENQNELQISMNSMTARTVGATLPLSDSSKAGTFSVLVGGANDYITGNEEEIRDVLEDYLSQQ